MTEDLKRVVNKQVDLNKDSLIKFFDERGSKYDDNNPYVSILYQDHNKDLAATRDRYEKNKITPLLCLDGTQRLLDIGCGIGRWADTIIDNLDYYCGIDFSAGLIERASERFKAQDNACFMVMDAKNISRSALPEQGLFDRIIISGVLIYMNDAEVKQALQGIAEICTENCVIYIREPLAHTARLTLDEFWSAELNSAYSAIYRTVVEMNQLIRDVFGVAGFDVKPFQNLYDDATMNNRAETSQFYTIFDNR